MKALLLLALAFPVAALAGESYSVSNPCGKNEAWELPEKRVPAEWREALTASFAGKSSMARSFSNGIAMRRFSRAPDARYLAEYWVSRSLLFGDMVHAAHRGFHSTALRALSSENPVPAAIPAAAVSCLVRIQERVPALGLSDELVAKLPALHKAAGSTPVARYIQEAASLALRSRIGRPGYKPEPLLSILKGAGEHETLALALVASRDSKHREAVQHWDSFLKAANAGKLPREIAGLADLARILIARSHFALGENPPGIDALKALKKSSNEISQALSELSWIFLAEGLHGEAIGTAINLQSGGLRGTFAPEGIMVMAMALNELCQFPEAVRAIRYFRRSYEPAYRWLTQDPPQDLYRRAVAFLKAGKSREAQKLAPKNVASEWLRSPVFISHQEEINLLFTERDSSRLLSRLGSKAQKELYAKIKTDGSELKRKIAEEKIRRKGNPTLMEKPLPSSLTDSLTDLKNQVTQFRRLRRGAAAWQSILATERTVAAATEKRLVGAITRELAASNERMKTLLGEIAENIQLIEVEIYQGASEDIVWKNAHPDYKETPTEEAERHAPTWNWGRQLANLEEDPENMEVWEDELGSFRANLNDNCSAKDRYLSLKQ